MSTEKVKVEHFDGNEELRKLYLPMFFKNCVYVEDCLLSEFYLKLAEDILNFEVKPDDVFVVTFPKSGTTWTQEMVWCIMNDLDFETASKKVLEERFPFLEIGAMLNQEMMPAGSLPECAADSVNFIRNLKGQRLIKSHLPLNLLPRQIQTHERQAKVIYVARDPRDVCVSYFHHLRLMGGFTGDLHTFLQLFVKGHVEWGPFWKHVLEFWKIRDSPNLLFLTYEEMKRDLGAVIARVATFLGKSLAPHQLQQLRQHLSFDSMKNNPSVNYESIINMMNKLTENADEVSGQFMRLGKSGGYKESLTKDEIDLLESWARENIEGTDYVLEDNKFCQNVTKL